LNKKCLPEWRIYLIGYDSKVKRIGPRQDFRKYVFLSLTMSHTIIPFGESHWKKWFLQKRGGKGRLKLVAPATKEEVADVENHLRFALPDSFRRVVITACKNKTSRKPMVS